MTQVDSHGREREISLPTSVPTFPMSTLRASLSDRYFLHGVTGPTTTAANYVRSTCLSTVVPIVLQDLGTCTCLLWLLGSFASPETTGPKC